MDIDTGQERKLPGRRCRRRPAVAPARLSDAVGAATGRGVPDLVNDYRVLEAQRRLAERRNDRLTVDAIGRGSGLGSRSAFYAAFRPSTGRSPARFRSGSRTPPGGREA